MHVFTGRPEDLKSEARKKILPVEFFKKEVLSKLSQKNIAIDYGAGAGYFTIPLAREFKKVYAVEANNEMAAYLEKELEITGLKYVEIIISNTPPDLHEIELDFILFSNVLHEVKNYQNFLAWAACSKVVCVIEWNKSETEFGPPQWNRIDLEEMSVALKKHFSFIKKLDIYRHHYVLIGYNDEGVWKYKNGR